MIGVQSLKRELFNDVEQHRGYFLWDSPFKSNIEHLLEFYESWMFSSWLCVDLVMQNTFKVERWQKKARGHISMDVPYFQSVLHAKICAKYQMWAFFGSGRLRTWFQSVFCTYAWQHLGRCRSFESEIPGKRCIFHT